MAKRGSKAKPAGKLRGAQVGAARKPVQDIGSKRSAAVASAPARPASLVDPSPVLPGLVDPSSVLPGLLDPTSPNVTGLVDPSPVLPGLADASLISPFSLAPAPPSKADRSTQRRLDPKLRMLSNGSQTVNAQRASNSACVASSAQDTITPLPLGTDASLADPADLKPRAKLAESAPADQAYVNVFIAPQPTPPGETSQINLLLRRLGELSGGAPLRAAPRVRGDLVAAMIPIAELPVLAAESAVSQIYASDPLRFEEPRVGAPVSVPPVRRQPGLAASSDSRDVLIGIIDVGGFDFAHPDFLDAQGRSRFVSIWDMGRKSGAEAPPPSPFDYGSELTTAQINAALDTARANHSDVRMATDLLRQSQQVPGSHATHVTSIAAGNQGICPFADIAGVLIELPRTEDAAAMRRTTFSDSSRIIDAVDYLVALGRARRQPVSINISLGTNGGGHDGASAVCRWLSAALAEPGRSICVAAGNSGDPKPRRITVPAGFAGNPAPEQVAVSGPIHAAGRIAARGLEVELDWHVQGYPLADMSENELEIWYPAADRLAVALLPPGETAWQVVRPRQFIENRRLHDGTTLSIYNELYYPANGANLIAIYLSPNYDPVTPTGVRAGLWRVRLFGEEVRDGRFNAWIERDDLSALPREDGKRIFRLPSFFSERSASDSHSLNSLACAAGVMGVANIDIAAGAMATSSSKGPTRDGRQKPDIAAPGTGIVAANGFVNGHAKLWVPMTGTSMASPYVAGVAAQMLQLNPALTAAQIEGIIQRTARPLPAAPFDWSPAAGFGVIDPEACLREAAEFDTRLDLG
jgi:subtilisin family serine protease